MIPSLKSIGDELKGVQATNYLKDKINQWLEDNPNFEGTEGQKAEALEKYFIETINTMQKYGGFSELWSKGSVGRTGGGTSFENIEKKILKNQNDPFAQEKTDLIMLDDDAIKKKYGMKSSKLKEELDDGTYKRETK